MNAPANPHWQLDFKPTLALKEIRGSVQLTVHSFFAVRPPHGVVHVPHQAAHFAAFHQKPVAAIEVEIREMLRGKRTDGQTFASSRAVGRDHAAQKPEQSGVLEAAFEETGQDSMIDVRKVAADIDLRIPRQPAREMLNPPDCGDGTLANAAGIGIENRASAPVPARYGR